MNLGWAHSYTECSGVATLKAGFQRVDLENWTEVGGNCCEAALRGKLLPRPTATATAANGRGIRLTWADNRLTCGGRRPTTAASPHRRQEWRLQACAGAMGWDAGVKLAPFSSGFLENGGVSRACRAGGGILLAISVLLRAAAPRRPAPRAPAAATAASAAAWKPPFAERLAGDGGLPFTAGMAPSPSPF